MSNKCTWQNTKIHRIVKSQSPVISFPFPRGNQLGLVRCTVFLHRKKIDIFIYAWITFNSPLTVYLGDGSLSLHVQLARCF